MDFKDSGLTADPLVEKAFDHAQDYVRHLAKEMRESLTEGLKADYDYEIEDLDFALEMEDIDQQDYDDYKAELDEQYAKDIADITPEMIQDGLTKLFLNDYVGPALEIQNYSDKAAPALIAAALLANCARDPVDCAAIEKAFGAGISGVIGEIIHINAYPADREDNMAGAGTDAKRLMLGQLTNILRRHADAFAKKDKDATFPLEEAVAALENARPLRGNDKSLDARFLTLFNMSAKLAEAPFHMEVTEKDTLELTQGAPRRAAPPAPQRKGPIMGDDGF